MNSLILSSGAALAPVKFRSLLSHSNPPPASKPSMFWVPPRLLSSGVCPHVLEIAIKERSKNWDLPCIHREINDTSLAMELQAEHRASTFMDEAQEKSEAMIAAGEAVEEALTLASESVHQNGAQAAKEAITKARDLASKYLNNNVTEHLAFLTKGLNLVGGQAIAEAITEAQALVSESINHLQKALNLASECLHERARGARAQMEAALLEAETLTSESLNKLLKAVNLVSRFLKVGDRDTVEALSLVLRDIAECLKELGRVKAANQRVAEIMNAFGKLAKNGNRNTVNVAFKTASMDIP